MTSDPYDRLYLDRAEYALDDAKSLINRAMVNLKYYGMEEEVIALHDVYYDVWGVLNKVEHEINNMEVKKE